jgi:hypothetical protein
MADSDECVKWWNLAHAITAKWVPNVTTVYVMTGGVLMLISYWFNVYYRNFHATNSTIFPAHAMMAYGRRGTVSLILNFGTRWV